MALVTCPTVPTPVHLSRSGQGSRYVEYMAVTGCRLSARRQSRVVRRQREIPFCVSHPLARVRLRGDLWSFPPPLMPCVCIPNVFQGLPRRINGTRCPAAGVREKKTPHLESKIANVGTAARISCKCLLSLYCRLQEAFFFIAFFFAFGEPLFKSLSNRSALRLSLCLACLA